MKKIPLYIIFLFHITTGCSSLNNTTFKLIKKYPHTIPDMEINFVNDTLAYVTKLPNKETFQKLHFIKKKRNYFIVSSSLGNDIVSLKKNDTIVLYKNELIIFNKVHKLIFKKKQYNGNVPKLVVVKNKT